MWKENVGSGGFGTVQKAWLPTEFQWVAIKFMENSYSDPMVREQYFYHELNMSCDHQYLVSLKGYCPS